MKGSPSVNQPRIRAVTNWIFLRAAGPDRPRVILPEKVFPAARELEERFPALRYITKLFLAWIDGKDDFSNPNPYRARHE